VATNRDKKKKSNKEKKQPKSKFIVFTALAVQMGVLIYFGAAMGKYLDQKYLDNQNKAFTIVFTILAIVISFYFLIKKVNQINNEEDN